MIDVFLIQEFGNFLLPVKPLKERGQAWTTPVDGSLYACVQAVYGEH
jgi:hypothetical protein